MSSRTADLLDALDPEQRQVAEALRGPVRVLAGAGTGKTRAITHRIAHGVATGVYQPTEVLAVTFTTRAAGEMRTRLRQLGAPGVQARTFHAAADYVTLNPGRDCPSPARFAALAGAAVQLRNRLARHRLRPLPLVVKLTSQWLGGDAAAVIGVADAFSAAGIDEILDLAADATLKTFVSRYAAESIEVEVDDPAICADVDTPEQYDRLIRADEVAMETGSPSCPTETTAAATVAAAD